jgi:hypothetical protein
VSGDLSLTSTRVLTATATFPLVASAGAGPVYTDGPVPSPASGGIEGEEVTHMKMAAVLGGPSQLRHLTQSGREVLVR